MTTYKTIPCPICGKPALPDKEPTFSPLEYTGAAGHVTTKP